MSQNKTAESRAENYVRKQLELIGWNLNKVKFGGDCYEKQELNEIPIFKNYPLRPEFILCISKVPLVAIECKSLPSQIDLASKEAKDYAKDLHMNFAVGVAGNESDGVAVQNWFYNGKDFELITYHGAPLSQILSKKYVERLLILRRAEIDRIDLPDESRFYNEAEYIHNLLFSSSVPNNKMAVILAVIILAFYSNPKLLTDAGFNDLELINALAQKKLREFGKDDLLEIFSISNAQSSVFDKLKDNLPLIISSLQRLDVLPLLISGADILGKFFEMFLRFSNDQKELGIVFTPRHIIEFMCDLIDLQTSDRILDPCCGTGGFLVGAFTKIREEISKEEIGSPKDYERKINNLKSSQIYGIEQEVSGVIYGLSCLNMIFRGDGHTNVKHADCFTQNFDFEFDKILINPPYSQKKKNSNGQPETAFLDYSLLKLKKGGLLCAIVPYSVFCDQGSWRKTLSLNHTVIASISVPPELFYPISAPTIIVLIEAHIPQAKKPIFFARIEDDGFEINRQKRTQKGAGQQMEVLENFLQWRSLIKSGKNKNFDLPKFIITKSVEHNDPLFELVPEAHLTSPLYADATIVKEIDHVLREQASFQLKYASKLRENKFKQNKKADVNLFFKKNIEITRKNLQNKNLSDFFESKLDSRSNDIIFCEYGQRELHDKSWLKSGKDIIIASGGVENGLYGFYDFEPRYLNQVITCPSSGSICEAFVQEFPCSVYDNTLVFIPKSKTEREVLYYISAILRLEVWRYRYGRQVTPSRLSNLVIDMSFYDKDIIKKFRNNLPFFY